MIVLRKKNKSFSQVPQQQQLSPEQREVDSKQLQIENMRMQRMILQNQRMKQRLEAEERNAKIKSLAKIQQAEAKKDEAEKDNQVKVQKMSEENRLNPADRNWRLVKSSAKPSMPVPMKH